MVWVERNRSGLSGRNMAVSPLITSPPFIINTEIRRSATDTRGGRIELKPEVRLSHHSSLWPRRLLLVSDCIGLTL